MIVRVDHGRGAARTASGPLISRRRFGASVVAVGALAGLAACGTTAAPVAPPTGAPDDPPAGPRHIIAYGDDPSQYGELTLPAGPATRGLVVVVHGGYWLADFDLSLGRPIAAELAGAGWATWNVEYRRIGRGGGWPTTLQDAAAAMDHVARLPVPGLDRSRIYLMGHSAGGHLAAWLASRPGLPPGSPGASPAVRPAGVVSQAGVLDLVAALAYGATPVEQLLGGDVRTVPDRYQLASPIARLPTRVRTVCVHGTADAVVPIAQSESYVAAATALGDPAELVRVDGASHMDLIDVGSPAWNACASALDRISS